MLLTGARLVWHRLVPSEGMLSPGAKLVWVVGSYLPRKKATRGGVIWLASKAAKMGPEQVVNHLNRSRLRFVMKSLGPD